MSSAAPTAAAATHQAAGGGTPPAGSGCAPPAETLPPSMGANCHQTACCSDARLSRGGWQMCAERWRSGAACNAARTALVAESQRTGTATQPLVRSGCATPATTTFGRHSSGSSSRAASGEPAPTAAAVTRQATGAAIPPAGAGCATPALSMQRATADSCLPTMCCSAALLSRRN